MEVDGLALNRFNDGVDILRSLLSTVVAPLLQLSHFGIFLALLLALAVAFVAYRILRAVL